MSFFDNVKEGAKNIGEKVSGAAKTAADKTTEAYEVARLKSAINSEKNSIADIKKEIGNLIYDEFTTGKELPLNVSELCLRIKEHLDKIESLEAEIKAQKEKKDES